MKKLLLLFFNELILNSLTLLGLNSSMVNICNITHINKSSLGSSMILRIKL